MRCRTSNVVPLCLTLPVKPPTGSSEAAHILDILSCVSCATSQNHFTVPDKRCVFKKTQLLSIFRATVIIGPLNYRGTRKIKTCH